VSSFTMHNLGSPPSRMINVIRLLRMTSLMCSACLASA
jgi:hypothetical protein